eukprot:s1717_g6.t1
MLRGARACQRLFGERLSSATLPVRNAATIPRLLSDRGHQLVTSSCLVSHGDSSDVVNQKNRELRSRLASMPWPQLTSVEDQNMESFYSLEALSVAACVVEGMGTDS